MGNEVIVGLIKKECKDCAGYERCGMMKIGCWNKGEKMGGTCSNE